MIKNVLVSAVVLATSASAVAGTKLYFQSGAISTQGWAQRPVMQVAGQTQKDLIVQFKNKIKESDRKWLSSLGAEIFGYLPEDALVIRISSDNLGRLSSATQVQAVVPYLSQYKVSTEFGRLSVFNQFETEKILIKAFKAQEAEGIAQAIENHFPNAVVSKVEGKFIVAQARKGDLLKMASLAGVENVQPHPEFKTMFMDLAAVDGGEFKASAAGDYSDLSGFETGTKVMNFDSVWAQGWTGKGQVASMADTGLDSGNVSTVHKDFNGRVINGHAVGLFGKSWADPMGHGTHVAGSIIGNGSASNGFLKGGAPGAGFVAQGMWSPMLDNLSVPNKLGDMFAKAYTDGARVHSNSWGAARNFGAYDNFAIQADEYMFNNPDMLILFAAGNSGVDANKDGRIDSGSMSSPGTAKNVLTVGASENKVSTGGIQVPISRLRSGKDQWGAEPIYSSLISDNENGMAMFSSRGPTNDGRTKPDVVAPGTNILSVKSQEKTADPLWGAYNTDYVWSGGTSMSTPLVAGAATVLRQYLVEAKKMASPSAAAVKAVLMNRAIDMYPGQFGEVGVARGQELLTTRPNSDQGYGRVDAAKMIDLANAVVIDDKVGVAVEESKTFQVDVKKTSKFVANLVWTDAPGSANASKALVNDLDLNFGGNGVSKRPADRINNHEVIEMTLEPGLYTLEVKGFNVPQGKAGKQPFALVYSLE